MQKLPFCSAKKLREIAAVCPTPFHLYDEKGIRETARRVQAAFSWNAGFREHFAVKANPNPYILSVLKSEGCGVGLRLHHRTYAGQSRGLQGRGHHVLLQHDPRRGLQVRARTGRHHQSGRHHPHRVPQKERRHPGKDLSALQPRRRTAHRQHLHGPPVGRQIRHDPPADISGHPHAAKRGRQAVWTAHAPCQQFHGRGLLPHHRPHALQVGRGSARDHGRGLFHGQPLRRRRHSLPPAAVARRHRGESPTMCAGSTSA